MIQILALLGALLGQFPAPASLPKPTMVYRELRLDVEPPAVTKGPPWLHLHRDGADWGGSWHLMGWDATPPTGPDYNRIILYLQRSAPGNGQIMAFEVDMPGYLRQAPAQNPNGIGQLALDRGEPATTAGAANRNLGLAWLWMLCEGS